MSDELKIETVTAQVQSRRVFVKTAAKVAVTAPAAALLLNASMKPAKASTEPYAKGFDDTRIDFGDDSSDDVVFVPGDDFLQ